MVGGEGKLSLTRSGAIGVQKVGGRKEYARSGAATKRPFLLRRTTGSCQPLRLFRQIRLPIMHSRHPSDGYFT